MWSLCSPVSVFLLGGFKMDEKCFGSENASVDSEISIKDLHLLKVSQAAKLFNIGERTIRGLVASHPRGDWYLKNGNRVMIKNKKFAEFLDYQSRI